MNKFNLDFKTFLFILALVVGIFFVLYQSKAQVGTSIGSEYLGEVEGIGSLYQFRDKINFCYIFVAPNNSAISCDFSGIIN